MPIFHFKACVLALLFASDWWVMGSSLSQRTNQCFLFRGNAALTPVTSRCWHWSWGYFWHPRTRKSWQLVGHSWHPMFSWAFYSFLFLAQDMDRLSSQISLSPAPHILRGWVKVKGSMLVRCVNGAIRTILESSYVPIRFFFLRIRTHTCFFLQPQ